MSSPTLIFTTNAIERQALIISRGARRALTAEEAIELLLLNCTVCVPPQLAIGWHAPPGTVVEFSKTFEELGPLHPLYIQAKARVSDSNGWNRAKNRKVDQMKFDDHYAKIHSASAALNEAIMDAAEHGINSQVALLNYSSYKLPEVTLSRVVKSAGPVRPPLPDGRGFE